MNDERIQATSGCSSFGIHRSYFLCASVVKSETNQSLNFNQILADGALLNYGQDELSHYAG